MSETNMNEIDFNNISPFLRHIHKWSGCSNEYYVPWRMIYDYELTYVIEGCAKVITENSEYLIEEGDIHIMSPFIRHKRFIPDGQYVSFYSLHFDLVFLGYENDFSAIDVYCKPCILHTESVEVDNSLFQRPFVTLNKYSFPQKMKTINSSSYIKILKDTYDAWLKKPYGYELDTKIGIISLLKLILCDMHTYSLDKNFSPNPDRIAAALQYVYDNYNKEINFNVLASSLGYSPNYFRKIFKQITGKATKEFLMDLRIEKATDLIAEGKHTITEISELVGYEDIHYFSKLFKTIKGCPPSAYNKKTNE